MLSLRGGVAQVGVVVGLGPAPLRAAQHAGADGLRRRVEGRLGNQQTLLISLPGDGGAADGQNQLVRVLYALVRVQGRAQGVVDGGDGGQGRVLVVGGAKEAGEVLGMVVVGHQNDLVRQFSNGPAVVAVIVHAVGGGGHHGHVERQIPGLQSRVQGGEKLGEALPLGGAEPLKVNGHALVGVGVQAVIGPAHLRHDRLHRLGAALGSGEQVRKSGGGIHIYAQMEPDPGALELLNGGGIALGDAELVAALGGGVERGPAIGGPGHPAPAQADRVKGFGQLDLAVGGDGVESVGPLRGGVELVVDPHQHGRSLLPGGGAVRGEGGGGAAVDDAKVIGHGDVPPVCGHVGEGEGVGVLGQMVISQGPHQHDRHLPAGDGLVRAEGAAGVHRAGGSGGVDGLPGPVAGEIGEGVRRWGLPAEHPGEDSDELGPAHGFAHAEVVRIHAVHEAVAAGGGDRLPGPAGGGQVGEGPVGRGGEQEGDQDGEDVSQLFHGALLFCIFTDQYRRTVEACQERGRNLYWKGRSPASP